MLARAILGVGMVVAFTAEPIAAADRPMCFGERATIVGDGSDIIGTPKDDVIVGTDDVEDIYGRAGDDLICGRRGDGFFFSFDEWLDGGAGRDRIQSGRESAYLFGGSGKDILVGGPGMDLLDGEGGSDVIRGGSHVDGLTGGPGNDLLIGGGGGRFGRFDTAAFLEAPRGVNVHLGKGFATGWGRDALRGIEFLKGSNGGPNTLVGDRRTNVIWGGRARDRIRGGGGDDEIDGKGGDDDIDGGPGSDLLSFPDETEIGDLKVGVDLDLLAGSATMGPHRDRVARIERVKGTEFDDLLRGDDGANLIDGGTGGTDTVEGRGGNDRLQGYRVDGGDGHDVCVGADVRNCEADDPDGNIWTRRTSPHP